MKKIFPFLIALSLFSLPLEAQKFLNSQNSKKYSVAAVMNADYGIIMYQPLNKNLGGDSTRFDYRNVFVQGWLEDYYDNGKLLHKGNYVDGKLNVYKNYFENGQVERSFEVTGLDKFYMQVFYPDGKVRSTIHYKGTAVQKEEDFYPSGKPDFVEEFSKDMEYVVQRKSWYESGKEQDVFELKDVKKKLYNKKEYYESGKIKEEGAMVFNREAIDYQKDGVWKTYDENGKVTSEDNYVLGTISVKEKTKEELAAEKKKQQEDERLKAEAEKLKQRESEEQKKRESAAAKALADKEEERKKKEREDAVKKAQATKYTKPAPAAKPTTAAKLPAEFKPADKDKDGKISPLEINAAIDAFFDDKGDYTPEKINKLIDYFFEQ